MLSMSSGRRDNQDEGNMMAWTKSPKEEEKKNQEPKEKYPTAHHLIFVVFCFSSSSHGDGDGIFVAAQAHAEAFTVSL